MACKAHTGYSTDITSSQWIAEFETAETKTSREKTENEDCIKKKKAVCDERAALVDKKRPCEAVLQSGTQCSTTCLPNSSGQFYCAHHQP